MSQWSSILSTPASPNQEQAFAALQTTCHARGVDTPYILLHSSLQAMRSQQPDAKFMTVSGDLLAHSFSCRYTTFFPDRRRATIKPSSLKTLSFVMGELRASFRACLSTWRWATMTLPAATTGSIVEATFLLQAGKIIAEGLPPSQRQQALKVFAKGGYYSLTMGAPMRNTRLIVVNDIFLSPKYSTCDGRPDSAAAAEEMTWLQEQLARGAEIGSTSLGHGSHPAWRQSVRYGCKTQKCLPERGAVMFLSSAGWPIC